MNCVRIVCSNSPKYRKFPGRTTAEGARESAPAVITASGREIALYLDINLDFEEPKLNLSYALYYFFLFVNS